MGIIFTEVVFERFIEISGVVFPKSSSICVSWFLLKTRLTLQITCSSCFLGVFKVAAKINNLMSFWNRSVIMILLHEDFNLSNFIKFILNCVVGVFGFKPCFHHHWNDEQSCRVWQALNVRKAIICCMVL